MCHSSLTLCRFLSSLVISRLSIILFGLSDDLSAILNFYDITQSMLHKISVPSLNLKTVSIKSSAQRTLLNQMAINQAVTRV